MMENPLLEQGKLYAHMAVVALAGKCGFVGIAATVSVESTLEATVYKKGVEPPQQVVPVVQHGQLLKGVVTLVAPPFGKPPSFGGLTVRLHVARMLRHGGAPKHSKEQAEALKSMPAWMQPKDTAIVHAFDAPLHVTADVVVLGLCPCRNQARHGQSARPKRLLGRGWPEREAAWGMLWH